MSESQLAKKREKKELKRKIKRISKLKTRPSDVFNKKRREILSNLSPVIDLGKWGQIVLPVNFAKTMMMMWLSFWFIMNGKRVIFITSDQTNTVSRSKLSFETRWFKKILKRFNFSVEDEYNITTLSEINSICNELSHDKKSVGLITCSDMWFIENIDYIFGILKRFNFDKSAVWNNDESSRGASSSHETTEGNTGIAHDEAEYKATKYKAYKKVKKSFICLGYTGNRVKEHWDENFGTDEYVTLNVFPLKEETWTMMSAPRKPIVIDVDAPMETNLSTLFNEVFKRQQEQDIYIRENNCKGIGKKHTGLIQLAHGLTNKNTHGILLEVLPSIKVEREWVGMHLAITTSSKGIQIFKFTESGIFEMSKEEKIQFGYVDDATMREQFNDDTSPLRILCIIDKGLKGSNDPCQTSYMTFRKYTTKGVEHNEEQGDGRLKRIAELLENIIDSIENRNIQGQKSNKELFIDLWYILNTYQPFIPDESGYTRMYENTKDYFYTADEVLKKLKQMDW